MNSKTKRFLAKFHNEQRQISTINQNCLRDFACPKCGGRDDFRITGTSTFKFQDDGSSDHDDIQWEDRGYIQWEDRGYIQCQNDGCNHEGTVKGFTFEGLDDELEAMTEEARCS